MRIGLDMDGVLTDFNSSFTSVIREHLNPSIPEPSDDWPDDWYYFRRFVNTSEEKWLWDYIQHPSTKFWENLNPLPGAIPVAMRLSLSNDTYFVTTRHGKGAKRQSEMWFCRRAAIGLPTVLIADGPEEKGQLCSALKLDAFIDDRWENCERIKALSPRTQVFMLDRPYNQREEPDGVVRVGSLEEFEAAL